MSRSHALSMALVALLAWGCGTPQQGDASVEGTPAAAPTTTPAISPKPADSRLEEEPPPTPGPQERQAWADLQQRARQLRLRTETLLEGDLENGWRNVARSMGQVQAATAILVHELAALEPEDEAGVQRADALRRQAESLLQAYAAMLETVAPAPTPTPPPEAGEEGDGGE